MIITSFLLYSKCSSLQKQLIILEMLSCKLRKSCIKVICNCSFLYLPLNKFSSLSVPLGLNFIQRKEIQEVHRYKQKRLLGIEIKRHRKRKFFEEKMQTMSTIYFISFQRQFLFFNKNSQLLINYKKIQLT